MKIPQVYFLYARPFDEARRFLWESKNLEYPSKEFVVSEIERISEIWKKINQNDFVMKSIIDILGVNQEKDFEFAVFGDGMNPMSVPLLLPIYNNNKKLSDNVLIETMIHELIHCFISDNRFYSVKNYWRNVRENYSNESRTTRVHILVYAILIKILPSVITEKDILEVESSIIDLDYKRAHEIAKEKDPQFFIDEFKKRVVLK